MVDLVVAPKVWSVGICWVLRRLDRDVRENVKFSEFDVRDWIFVRVAWKIGSGCYKD